MIKRLAHRNANVQLYTMEVGIPLKGLGTEADTVIAAGECAFTELWCKDAQRASFQRFYGGCFKARQ